MNSNQGIYMDVDAVRSVSNQFAELSEQIAASNKRLEVLFTVLRVTAFVGLIGGKSMQSFIDQIKPRLSNLTDHYQMLSQDLEATVKAYERGDATGSTRFY
ncbi:MAG: hypothetical protein KDE51_08210 [Anaerolineales bacterium]|nr:hypothetical protein [Anaerolineales bacterium]